MMEPTLRPNREALYTTLEQIRAEHARLLDADTGDDAPGPEFWADVHRFAMRIAESGIYFDEPHEVKACQGYLSYWGRELSCASAEKRFSGDPKIPELSSFDEQALRALQPRYANPFEGLAAEATALPKEGMRTTYARDEFTKLVERRAFATGLRFELDLVKEITGQLAGDAFAPTLIEFCFYHLFEDPRTRIGNKLRRPPPERSLSCLQYLVDKADWLYRQQGPSEQHSMLDALSLYGAGLYPGVPSDAIIPRARIDAVEGAASPTFKDTAGRTLALRPFLVSTRLLFEAEPGLSIVHPTLLRRWPELLANIRVRKDREQLQRKAWLTLAGLAALVFAGLALWMGLKVRGEENQTSANALAAQAYRTLWALEACRAKERAREGTSPSDPDKTCGSRTKLGEVLSKALAAVEISPTPRAMAALNEAIGAMLAADVRASRDRQGKLTAKPLAWRGAAPGACPPERATSGSACFVDSTGRSVKLPGVSQNDTLFATAADEKRVALAWPAFDPYTWKVAERVELKAFAVEQDGSARSIDGLRDNRCHQRSVSRLRLTPDGQLVILECAGSSNKDSQPLWDVIALSDDAWKRIPPDRLRSMRENDAILSVYFADSVADGYATLNEGGEVEVFSSSDDKPVAAYQSDFLRSTGRPENLGFHPKQGFAAVGSTLTFDYPLVLVNDQEGRDRTYLAPSGLGTPQRVDYSPNGKCIEIRTIDQKRNAFAYHIVLDETILIDVAKQMGGSTPRYEARSLCGFPEAPK